MVKIWQHPDTPPLDVVCGVKLCASVNIKREDEEEEEGGTAEIISCLAVRGGAGGKRVS